MGIYQVEIFPQIISNNIFLCKNFRYGFVNELLIKKTLANQRARNRSSRNDKRWLRAIDPTRTSPSNVRRGKCVECNKYF